MSMMRISRTAFVTALAFFTLAACTSEKSETSEPDSPRYVKLADVSNIPNFDEFTFPAVVSAVKTVDLSFEVSGRLIQTDLVTGNDIEKGKLLATIDRKPFERRMEESKTRLEQSERELNRIEKMFSQKLVAQSTLDSAKTSYELAMLDLRNAEQDLSYCTIRAPFDAVVGARYIENDSLIRSGDSLANLQDRSELYFTFEVPERIMTANVGNRDVKASAHIIGQEDNVYDIHYVEHKTTPDPITQTYGVTFALKGEVANAFYPGSRAIVNIMPNNNSERALLVPLSALVGNSDAGFSVWRLNEQDSKLTQVKVNVSKLHGEYALLSSGIKAGDKVVSAAVGQMREGLLVREYKATY